MRIITRKSSLLLTIEVIEKSLVIMKNDDTPQKLLLLQN